MTEATVAKAIAFAFVGLLGWNAYNHYASPRLETKHCTSFLTKSWGPCDMIQHSDKLEHAQRVADKAWMRKLRGN